MDRSMDSIGSCSLDVDAESSDVSDTSGSLNFPTPISIKDITREFTANIRERCSLQTVKNSTTAYIDPVTGQVCIALTQPTTLAGGGVNNNIGILEPSHNSKSNTQTPVVANNSAGGDTYDKKPSYLNLACCVNGYSNITTYDSKIRQDINKSREVSPIRPSSSSLQYCKKSNSLAPPVLLAMPNVNLTSPQAHTTNHLATNGAVMTTIGTKYTIIENNNHSTTTATNGEGSLHSTSAGDDAGGGGGVGVGVGCGVNNTSAKRSFIQQRVERLYGPGALAQGFYSPKKIRDSPQRLGKSNGHENGVDGGGATSELARKFQELSPSKDYNQFRKKLYSNGRPSIPTSVSSSSSDNVNAENNNIDLPCLRHLSQEFRAQLPIVSPKRNFSRASPPKDTTNHYTSPTTHLQQHNGTTSNGNGPTNDTVTTLNSNSEHQPISGIMDYKSQISNSSLHKVGSVDEVDRQIVISLEDMELQTPSPPTKSEKVFELAYTNIDTTPLNTSSLGGGGVKQETETVGLNAEISPVVVLAAMAGDVGTSNGSIGLVKDAHFFLRQLKVEQARLLVLASEAEKYLDALASNPDITEDTLGLLRSASGKARLLVSQKMKQFEGLCHNNLNSSPEDQFPTTVDDLQGFWDMVYLQVDHIDEIFKEIELLKQNEWKKPKDLQLPVAASNTLKTPKPLKHFGKSRSNTPVANGGGSAGSGNGNTPSAAALKREAQRKKLQEIKRRNREALIAANAASPAKESGIVDEGLVPLEPESKLES